MEKGATNLPQIPAISPHPRPPSCWAGSTTTGGGSRGGTGSTTAPPPWPWSPSSNGSGPPVKVIVLEHTTTCKHQGGFFPDFSRTFTHSPDESRGNEQYLLLIVVCHFVTLFFERMRLIFQVLLTCKNFFYSGGGYDGIKLDFCKPIFHFNRIPKCFTIS